MNLAWHIAKKDLRRMAVPVLAWLTLVAVPTFAFCRASPGVAGHVASSLGAWISGLRIWVGLLVAIQWLIGAVLAGALIIDDPLVGTDMFWATRPISNARLLAGKLIAAVLLFLGSTLVVLMPLWFASGFGLRDVWFAAGEFIKTQGAVVLLALAAAALARNLAQFLLFLLVIAGAFFAAGWLAATFNVTGYRLGTMAVYYSREFLAVVVTFVTLAIVLVQQFLTRRVARGWTTLGLALLAVFVIRIAWPWDFWTGWTALSRTTRMEERPGDRAAEVVVAPTFTVYNLSDRARQDPNLLINTRWAAEGFYAPVAAKYADGRLALQLNSGWGYDAGLRIIGYEKNDAPLRWWLNNRNLKLMVNGANSDLEFNGQLEIWFVRPRVLGEIPVRVGAKFTSDAGHTRIIELGPYAQQEDKVEEIYLEERESKWSGDQAWKDNAPPGDSTRLRFIDRYFLVNRTAHTAHPLFIADLGTIEMNSIVVRMRKLTGGGLSDWRNAAVIKLRFECDHRFERPIEVHGVTETRH